MFMKKVSFSRIKEKILLGKNALVFQVRKTVTISTYIFNRLTYFPFYIKAKTTHMRMFNTI